MHSGLNLLYAVFLTWMHENDLSLSPHAFETRLHNDEFVKLLAGSSNGGEEGDLPPMLVFSQGACK